MKHTPGPWKIHSVNEDKCHFRIRGTIPGHKFKVANVPFVKDNQYDREEASSNAQLIASAPDLLAENARLKELKREMVEAMKQNCDICYKERDLDVCEECMFDKFINKAEEERE